MTPELTNLLRKVEVYIRHHQGHHPVACIGECSDGECGAAALAEAMHKVTAQQELI